MVSTHKPTAKNIFRTLLAKRAADTPEMHGQVQTWSITISCENPKHPEIREREISFEEREALEALSFEEQDVVLFAWWNECGPNPTFAEPEPDPEKAPRATAQTLHVNHINRQGLSTLAVGMEAGYDEFLQEQAAQLETQAFYAGGLGFTRSIDFRFQHGGSL